jgi:hypothetical protein
MQWAPVREMRRRGRLLGVAGRLVAAIGLAAIIPQFFVILMPPVRRPDSAQSFIAAVQSFTTALSQQHRSEDTPKPALAGFPSLLAPGDTGQAAEQQSENFQRFLRWRQKADPSEAAP